MDSWVCKTCNYVGIDCICKRESPPPNTKPEQYKNISHSAPINVPPPRKCPICSNKIYHCKCHGR